MVFLAARSPADGPRAPALLPDMGAPLTLDAAIRMALVQNPEITAVRQDHGVAAAAVVVARAYPFNPVWESRSRYALGPEFAGVFNHEPVENTVLLEMEIRGQGKYRKAAATAALSRTDWDIADQETALAVRVVRAFDGGHLPLSEDPAADRHRGAEQGAAEPGAGPRSRRASCIRWTSSSCAPRSTTPAPSSARGERPWRRPGANCAPRWARSAARPSTCKGT